MKQTKSFGMIKINDLFYKLCGRELYEKTSETTAKNTITEKIEEFDEDDTITHYWKDE